MSLGRYLKRRAVWPRLRMFLTSQPWYLWLGIGGIGVDTLIYAMVELFPETASWPQRVLLVVYGLFWIGFLVFFGVMMRFAGGGLARLLLMGVLPDIADRTDKAKEKFADSLMSVSNTIHSATLLGILVVPLTAFLQTIVSGKDPVPLLLDYLRTAGAGTGETARWHGFLLGFLICVPAVAASYMKRQALNLYDELSERAALPPALRWRPKSLGNRSRK
jgi:hypothetical protein